MERLPVKLTADDVRQNPGFCHLLSSLSQHLNEDGTSKRVEDARIKARDQLNEAKTRWLQYKLLHGELKELLMDEQIRMSTGTACSASQFYAAVQESLTLAEIGGFINCSPDPSSNVTLLGLTQTDIDAYHPYKKHLPSMQQKLIPEIEARLREKCENLVHYYDTSASSPLESRQLTFARSSELPAKLTADINDMNAQRESLHREQNIRQKLAYQYQQALMQLLGLLEKLILRHRLQSQSDSDTTTAEWLAARCDAMRLKFKLLELHLLCDTYHRDAVNALTIIRRELDSAVTRSEHEMLTATQTLQAYEAVGMGFQELVHEFTELQEEIEKRRWAIREFQFSLDDKDA